MNTQDLSKSIKNLSNNLRIAKKDIKNYKMKL